MSLLAEPVYSPIFFNFSAISVILQIELGAWYMLDKLLPTVLDSRAFFFLKTWHKYLLPNFATFGLRILSCTPTYRARVLGDHVSTLVAL